MLLKWLHPPSGQKRLPRRPGRPLRPRGWEPRRREGGEARRGKGQEPRRDQGRPGAGPGLQGTLCPVRGARPHGAAGTKRV